MNINPRCGDCNLILIGSFHIARPNAYIPCFRREKIDGPFECAPAEFEWDGDAALLKTEIIS